MSFKYICCKEDEDCRGCKVCEPEEEEIPEWVPYCKKCDERMVDATAMIMGRFRCPNWCQN